jgi:2EXR family
MHIMDGTKLEEFTCFPNLVPELRNRIWSLASTQPQIMKIQHTIMVVDEGVRANGLVQDSMAELFSTDVKASSVLSVYKESRGNFLLKFPDTIETVEVGRVIRFNATENTILLWATAGIDFAGLEIVDLPVF